VKIVYVTFRGHFSDSPRALYRAIRERGIDAEHTWLSAEHTQRTFPADVQTITFGSPESIEALEAADLVISNDHIPLDWDKRPGATYLQTWHGTMLKRIHRDVLWAPEGRLDYLEHDIARWDHLLSPNPVTTPRLRKAFGYTGPLHETGLPRNDVLSGPDADAVRARVRAELGIPDGTTAVLYTPTWRDDLVFDSDGQDYEFAIDMADFAARLGDDHVLLVRLHSIVAGRLPAMPGLPIIDVSAVADTAGLYLAADLMVTDYSSSMVDFAITGKPMLFFTYDLEHYRDDLRGFYFDLAEVAPGPLVSTSTELVTAIGDVEAIAAANADRYARFRQTFCSLEDGHATDRVLDLLFPSGAPATGAGPSTSSEGDDVRAD
jgi:CDP-glycerol glycerophosphotransferase (TagB/SpsB family)